MSSNVQEVTDATFETDVLQSEKPVVVDFWAAWCGPCRMVSPELERLAEKYDGSVEVVKVDVDANPGISQAFNILSLPTIAFFRPGQQPMGVVGFRPLEQLEQHFGLAERAVVGCDPDVGGQGELAAAAQGVATDGRDHRLGDARDGRHRALDRG